MTSNMTWLWVVLGVIVMAVFGLIFCGRGDDDEE